MSQPWGNLAFVGTNQSFDGNGPGVIVYHYNEDNCTWDRINFAGCLAPSDMLFVPNISKLFVAGAARPRGPTLTSFTLARGTRSLTFFEASIFARDEDLRHICLDPERLVIYGILEKSVHKFRILASQEMGEPYALPITRFHLMLISNIRNYECVFVSLDTNSIDSVREIFIINGNPGPDLLNRRIFIKFKSEAAMELLKIPGSTLIDYYVYIVQVRQFIITMYENVDGALINDAYRSMYPRLVPTYSIGTNYCVSDVVAPSDLPFLFIANYGPGTIAIMQPTTYGKFQVTFCRMPKDQHPVKLYYRNRFLYVATCDSIFIYHVNMNDVSLNQVDVITGVPQPSCMLFTIF